MIRLLINVCIFGFGAALGLLAAVIALPDMSLTATGFLFDVVIFAVLRAIFSPFLLKLTLRNARALVGGVGLFTTLVALIATALISDGLKINGLQTWVFATLIVWLVSMFSAFLLPYLILKGFLGARLRTAARSKGGTNSDSDNIGWII